MSESESFNEIEKKEKSYFLIRPMVRFSIRPAPIRSQRNPAPVP